MKRSPIRKRNPERHRKEWIRAYGSEARVEWIKKQGCVVCGAVPSENAHCPPRGEAGGMGRKADAKWIAPLCYGHHRLLHKMGIQTFEFLCVTDLSRKAEQTEIAWRVENGEAAA